MKISSEANNYFIIKKKGNMKKHNFFFDHQNPADSQTSDDLRGNG